MIASVGQYRTLCLLSMVVMRKLGKRIVMNNDHQPDPGTPSAVQLAALLAAAADQNPPDPSLAQLVACGAALQRFEAGEVIFHRGSQPSTFFFLVSGQVDVLKAAEDGEERMLQRLVPGDFFGEVSLLQDKPRSATVRTSNEGAAEVLAIGWRAFDQFMTLDNQLSRAIGSTLLRRLNSDSISAAFPGLPAPEVAALALRLQQQTLGQGETLFRQDDRGEDFYIVSRGRLEVLHTNRDGRTFLINFHEPGEYIGEVAALSGGPRSATVRAAEDTELIVVDKDSLTKLMTDYPEVRDVLEAQASRRRAAIDHLGE